MENQKKDPNWKPASSLDIGKPAVIKLLNAKPVWSGKTKFGDSNLWAIEVENQLVFDRDTNAEIKNYTGKATFFPSQKLHEQLIGLTNGTQEGVKVRIGVKSEKNKENKFYTSYTAELVEVGQSPPSNLLHTHYRFVEMYRELVKFGKLNDNKDDFFGMGKSQTFQIHDDAILEQLWNVYKEQPKTK